MLSTGWRWAPKICWNSRIAACSTSARGPILLANGWCTGSDDLRVAATLQHIDFAREDFDLAIRHGDGQWPELHVTQLCAEELFPVCSPSHAHRRPALRTPADLKNRTLLHVNERRDWATWLEAANVDDVDFRRGPIFNQASIAID